MNWRTPFFPPSIPPCRPGNEGGGIVGHPISTHPTHLTRTKAEDHAFDDLAGKVIQ